MTREMSDIQRDSNFQQRWSMRLGKTQQANIAEVEMSILNLIVKTRHTTTKDSFFKVNKWVSGLRPMGP